MIHHSTQPFLIFNRENLQNFKLPNSLWRGLDYIVLVSTSTRLNPAQLIHWLPCPLIFCAWTVAFQIKHREGIITTKCINYGSFNVFTAFPIPDPWSKGFNAFRKSSQTPLVHDKVCTEIELLRQFHIIPLFLFEDNFCLLTIEHWSNF